MTTAKPMRVAIVYDCLFPYTIGGAERWYRNMAELLAQQGHEVEYLTMRQWDAGEAAEIPGVRVVAVGPRMNVYGKGGARRLQPPIVFGIGLFFHLLIHGRKYDVVHTASFPYFSLFAAGALRPFMGYRLAVDWHEFWLKSYWIDYLGPLQGRIGWLVQSICLRFRQQPFCFARLTADRLRAHHVNGQVTILEGEYVGRLDYREPETAEPFAMFAARHIPEKRGAAVTPAIIEARRTIPDLRGKIFGRGPQTELIREQAAASDGAVEVCGVVSDAEIEANLSKAMCMILPSMREGYGMIVIEAAAHGTPIVLVEGADNASTEHIAEGVNGFVCRTASPQDLAEAMVKIHSAGHAMRLSTARWYADNAKRLSMRNSLEVVVAAYDEGRR